MRESLCTANLFVDPATGTKSMRDLTKILSHFGLSIKPESGSLQFDLTGFEFDQIKEDLVDEVVDYLDTSRRSCLMYFGNDGELHTIIIQDGEVLYA